MPTYVFECSLALPEGDSMDNVELESCMARLVTTLQMHARLFGKLETHAQRRDLFELVSLAGAVHLEQK